MNKLLGKRVKAAVHFAADSKAFHKGDAGTVTAVEIDEYNGYRGVTVDWTGSSFEGEGWGSAGHMWCIVERHLPHLRYLNNKPVVL